MRKLKPYILPVSILILGLAAIYFLLFRTLDFENNIERSVALLVSSIGLVFGIFQVFLNLEIQAERNKTQLRHSDYKELIKLLNSISDLMNESLINELNLKGLVASLFNKKNEFLSFIFHNDGYLFKGLMGNKIIENCLIEIEALCVRTDKYRYELEKVSKDKVSAMFLHDDWHNDVIGILEKYNKSKYEALKEIRKKI